MSDDPWKWSKLACACGQNFNLGKHEAFETSDYVLHGDALPVWVDDAEGIKAFVDEHRAHGLSLRGQNTIVETENVRELTDKSK